MARAVVLFVRAEDARGVLEAAKRARAADFFTWIGSDGWGTQEKLVEGIEDVAEGAITVELQSREVTAFDNYMSMKRADNNPRNPWWKEYWEEMFNCRLPGHLSDRPSSSSSSSSSSSMSPVEHTHLDPLSAAAYRAHLPVCRSDLVITESPGYKQESKVQFVIDAVYAMAHALHAAWRDLCSAPSATYSLGASPYIASSMGSRTSGKLCDKFKELDGGEFYRKYLLNTSFTGESVTLSHSCHLVTHVCQLVITPFEPVSLSQTCHGLSLEVVGWEERLGLNSWGLVNFFLSFSDKHTDEGGKKS